MRDCSTVTRSSRQQDPAQHRRCHGHSSRQVLAQTSRWGTTAAATSAAPGVPEALLQQGTGAINRKLPRLRGARGGEIGVRGL